MSFIEQLRHRPRLKWALIAGGALAAVLIGVLIAALVGAANPAAKPEKSDPPKPETDSAAPPTSVHLAAEFASWAPSPDDGAVVQVQGGDAPDGDVALLIDTPGAVGSVVRQQVSVKPESEFEFTAWVRTGTEEPAARFTLNGAEPSTIAIPATSGEWVKLSETIKTGSESALTVGIATDAAVSGVGVDGITVGAKSADAEIVNASFEEYTAATQVTNESLIMATNEAYLGLSWRSSGIQWTVADSAGAQVADGSATPANGLTLLKFGDLAQGYYTAELKLAESSDNPIQVSFLVLDGSKQQQSQLALDKRFGVMIHPSGAWYEGSDSVAAELGFGSFRFATGWVIDEPTEGSYNFSNYAEPIVKSFADRGIAPLAVSGFQNPYYDDNRTPSTASGIDGFASYASALVGHYGADSVEVWNEFNHAPFNNGECGLTAECYMELLKPTAERVRAENPGTLVVGPVNARKDDAFLTAFYQAGGLNYVDAVSFHPYEYDQDTNKGAEFLVESLTQAQDRIKEYNNGQTKPIWITELGWSSAYTGDPKLQADYLVRAEVISLATGVERFYWYDLVNDDADPAHHEGSFGLVRQKTATVPTFEPKPAAAAQAILIEKLSNKPFASRDEVGAASYSYAFGSGADTTRVVWATSPTTVNYASTLPVTVTDQYGAVSIVEPVDGTITVTLGEQVLYLDGELDGASVK